MEYFKWIILGVVVLGVLSQLTNLLPSLVIIWVATLVYGIVIGFDLAGGIIFAILTILMIVGSLIDNVIMGASARQTGASWWSIAIALLAGVIGTILLPPFGGILFALLGIFIIEWIRLKTWREALESARSMAVGCGWSSLIRLGVGVIMLVLYVVWAFYLH